MVINGKREIYTYRQENHHAGPHNSAVRFRRNSSSNEVLALQNDPNGIMELFSNDEGAAPDVPDDAGTFEAFKFLLSELL